MHRFEFSTVIRGSESERSFLLLGSWNPRQLCDLVVFLGPLIKLWRFLKREAFVAISWEPPIKLWRLPQVCTGCDHPQGSLSGSRTSLLVGKLEENTERPSWHLGSLVAPHRSNGE